SNETPHDSAASRNRGDVFAARFDFTLGIGPGVVAGTGVDAGAGAAFGAGVVPGAGVDPELRASSRANEMIKRPPPLTIRSASAKSSSPIPAEQSMARH